MIGQRFDYSGERQRHEKLVGRVELLASAALLKQRGQDVSGLLEGHEP